MRIARLARLLILSVSSISSLALVDAQETREQPPIANTEIVEMVKAGLAADLIVAKIKTSTCEFDISPSALVSLKGMGVPDDVLMEMVRNPHGGQPVVEKISKRRSPPPEPVTKETPAPVADGLPEYGHISEIRRMRRLYVIADDIDSQNLLINSLSKYDGLQIVGSPDGAEVFVAFGQGSLATSISPRGLFAGTIDHRTKAQFVVFYKSESGRLRIVWQETEDIQTSSGLTLSRPNEVNVSRHFIKELRKVRGEID